MALQLACPHCQAHAAFDERLAGAVAVCEHCRGEFTVPRPPAAPPAGPLSPPPAQPGSPLAPPPHSQPAGSGWFLSQDGTERHGPYSDEQMRLFLDQKAIEKNSFVWRVGWPQWTRIRDTAEFGAAFQSSAKVAPRRSSSGAAPARRTPPIGLAVGSALAVFLFVMALVLGKRLLEKAEIDAADDQGPAADPGPVAEDGNGTADAPRQPAGVEGARELVRKGVSKVSRTFDGERAALSVAETPSSLLVRALAAVRTGELLVAHPSFERGHLESDRERIEKVVGERDRSPASIDLSLAARVGLAAEPALRAACERDLSGEDAWLEAAGPYEGLLARAGVGRDAFEAALQGGEPDAQRMRVYLFYFYYRLALVCRTRATLATLSVTEEELERALGGSPSRARIVLPDLPAPEGALVGPPGEQPGGDGLSEPEPEPEPERPPLEFGTALEFDGLAALIADRTEEEVALAARGLAGNSIAGRAIFLAYRVAADGQPARLEVRGETQEGDWTVRAEGQAMVPADDRLAASLDAGTPVDLAGPILSASVREDAGGRRALVLTIRVLKLSRASD